METITKPNSKDFFFSKQDKHLSQYQQIVSDHYKSELDIDLDEPGSNWNIHTIKRSGQSLIAWQDDRVVGGAMLYTTTGSRQQLLPLEGGHSLLQEIYGIDLMDTPYCEVGRLAIRRENRSMSLVSGLIDHIVYQSFLQGMHFLFVLAPRSNAVLYRRVCNQLGIQMGMIDFSKERLPAVYQHMEFRLIRVDLLEQPKFNPQQPLLLQHG